MSDNGRVIAPLLTIPVEVDNVVAQISQEQGGLSGQTALIRRVDHAHTNAHARGCVRE
jgi:hypothetical protein